MSKPKKLGMKSTYIPNAKADMRRNKRFITVADRVRRISANASTTREWTASARKTVLTVDGIRKYSKTDWRSTWQVGRNEEC